MTPDTREHMDRVQQLKTEWDEAEEVLRAVLEDMGLVAQMVGPDKQIDEPRRGLDPTEIEDATRKRDEARNRWREAVGMPPANQP